jgi:hypothetical protein
MISRDLREFALGRIQHAASVVGELELGHSGSMDRGGTTDIEWFTAKAVSAQSPAARYDVHANATQAGGRVGQQLCVGLKSVSHAPLAAF